MTLAQSLRLRLEQEQQLLLQAYPTARITFDTLVVVLPDYQLPTTLVIVSGRTHCVGNFDCGLKLGGGVHPARIGPRPWNELSDHGLGQTTGLGDVGDREMRIPRFLCRGRAGAVDDAQNGSLDL